MIAAAESSVSQVPHGTPTPDADDFFTPEFDPVPEPELVLEFEFETLLPVPELELFPETVSWPEISGKRKKKKGLVEPHHADDVNGTLHCWNVGKV
jgi:hypothetical protein